MFKRLPNDILIVRSIIFALFDPIFRVLLFNLLLELCFLLFKGFGQFTDDHLRDVMTEGAVTICDDYEPFLLRINLIIFGFFSSQVYLMKTERILVDLCSTSPPHITSLSKVAHLFDKEMT